MGQAEKTELDAHFENLMSRADCTKNWTEKIYRQTEVMLQPNPSMTSINPIITCENSVSSSLKLSGRMTKARGGGRM